MARDIQLAVAAAQLAVHDAGLAEGGVDPTRIGIDLGAGLISSELDEIAPAVAHATSNGTPFDYQTWGRESIRMIEPIWLLKYLPNMLACHISILIDCQGPSNTITEADASSNLAIAEAARVIARGRADVMITGGADSKIHPLSVVRMALAREHVALEGRSCAGMPALRPPSRRLGSRRGGRDLRSRRGTAREEAGREDLRRVPGRRLRLRRHALRRARSRGRRNRSRDHARRSKKPGSHQAEVGHVNAHGSATKVSDLAEARAFERVFGPRGVPVTALKGYMGNLVSGAGAVELICSLIAVNRGRITGGAQLRPAGSGHRARSGAGLAPGGPEPGVLEHQRHSARPGRGSRHPRLPGEVGQALA